MVMTKVPQYIAIDGMGGSGKTYFSERLAKKLNAQVYHLDDYGDDYKPFVGIPKLKAAVEQATAETVIYEGVGVFDSRLDDFAPFRILVAVPEEIKRQRATQRDVPREGRSADDWRQIWDIWIAAEAKYFTETISRQADIIIGVEDGQFDVDAVVRQLEARESQKGGSMKQLRKFITKHYKLLGSIGAAIALTVAAVYLVVVPEKAVDTEGIAKLLLLYAHSLCWLLIAAASGLWAIKGSNRWSARLLYAALVTYGLFVFSMVAL